MERMEQPSLLGEGGSLLLLKAQVGHST